MQGYVGMRGLISDTGVMNALSTNTKFMNAAFEKVLSDELPEDVKAKIKNIYQKGKEQLEYFIAQSQN